MGTTTSDRPSVSQVFTPRRHVVNSAMYIQRPMHERELKRSIEGARHTILSGESGSGKSWLYWHVAEVENWQIFTANSAVISLRNSVVEGIAAGILPDGSKELVEYSQKLEGKAEIFGFGGGAEAERKYSIHKRDLLLKAFESARHQAKNRVALVVIDNLEAIFESPELMAELGNVILLLDDKTYGQFQVKFLLVGVPGDIRDYFQRARNLESVANRLQEAPIVNSLSIKQIHEFVRRGFSDQLKIVIGEIQIKELAEHVEKVTLGIAERMHEYCELLGHRIEDNGWKFESRLLEIADKHYLSDCFLMAYSTVESFMNERRTKTGRRNQVLFALGKISATTFEPAFVEEIVRAEFPKTTSNVALAISQTLSELCEGDTPLLRRQKKGSAHRFADPRYLMCLRLMLKKDPETEKIIKRPVAR